MRLMRRKIDDFLKEWKENEDRLPLVVKGARQIGKTASIMQFANDNYKNVVAINFVLQQKFKSILMTAMMWTVLCATSRLSTPV